ncbi:MAG: LacI family transcriptional regulator [Phycisphaerae bacterium]|nr:LacI family transcriptional regulator [Phycisphaerae bacterium]
MKRASKRKVTTLKDIALLAGCSQNTVSLALRNSNRISKEMRKRIRQIARRLKYVPNMAARNLSTRRSGIIGVYTYALYDAVRTELINSLITELHTAEYRPVLGLGKGHVGPWHSSPWMQTFRELNVEAMVVVAETIDKLPQWTRRIPVILVGCHPNESFQCDYLAIDRKQAANSGIEHLISRGHKKILVACNEQSVFAQGCFDTIKKAGLKPYYVCVDYPCSEEQWATVLSYLTRQQDRPTAAIFGDSPLAAEFMHHLQKTGVKIPKDIAIVGYDYFPWAKMLKVPLTTINQPISELASQAVTLVKTRLTEPETPLVHTILPHKLMIRKSS